MTVRGFFSKRYKYRILTALLAACILFTAVGCSFIDPKVTTAPVEDDSPDPPSSSTTTTEPDDTPDAPDNSDSPVQVLFNEGKLNVHAVSLPLPTEKSVYAAFTYNDRYMLYLVYDLLKNADGEEYCETVCLYAVDLLQGEIVSRHPLHTQYLPDWISYTKDGCILCDRKYGSDPSVNVAFSITEKNGVFTVQEVEIQGYPYMAYRFVSPDGQHVAYELVENTWIHRGGVEIEYPDGSVKRITENVPGDWIEDDLSTDNPRFYSPVGFMDDTHIVYNILYVGSNKGYGIYDIVNDVVTEVNTIYSAISVYNGALYVAEYVYIPEEYRSARQAFWKVTADGRKTMVASFDADANVFTLPENAQIYFDDSVWKLRVGDAAGESIKTVLYSPDFDAKLAEIETPNGNVHVYDNSVTVVVPYLETPTEPGDITIHSLADWDALNFDGFFSTDGNCYELINGLVHFGGGADMSERYPEFQTVKIGAYTVRRDPEEKMLYFDFTVTESELENLQTGNYRTTVEPDYGPASDDAKMTVLAYNGAEKTAMDLPQRDAIRHLRLWFLAQRTWDVGEYGTYDVNAREFPDNYLAFYAEGRHALAEVNVWTKDLLGVILHEDDVYVKRHSNEDGTISLVPGYGGGSMIYDIVDVQIGEEADTITVQHYNEVNKLIPSVKVAYKIGHTGRIYGCELVEDSQYAPFGMLGETAYMYKDWKPMQ